MTTGDRMREFCIRHGLTQAEADYLLGLVGEAVLVERAACATLAKNWEPSPCDGLDYPEGDVAAGIAAALRARKE